ADECRNRFPSALSQFEINHAVRGDDAVFVFPVLARAEIDIPARGFDQDPTRRDIPQTDSSFDVSVEPTAGDVSHVERGTAEHTAFAHTMNHFVEQWEIPVDHLARLGKSHRNHGFGEVRALADSK